VPRPSLALTLALGWSLGCAGYTRDYGGLWNAGIMAGLAPVTSLPALLSDSLRGYTCPESCPPEFTCNHSTGLCSRMPCGGNCREGQQCVSIGPLERCVTPGTGTAETISGPWGTPLPVSVESRGR